MRLPRFAVLCSLGFLAVASTIVAQDEIPSQPKSGAKVCVATVGNASTTSAFVERLTERLTRSLKQNKVNAVTMDSRTTDKHPLQLSTDNGEEAKHPLEPQLPEISIGGRVPRVDASDPRSVYRETLQVAFALFRIGRFKPVLDTVVLERPSTNVSDTFLPAMDHEAKAWATS